MDFLMKYIAIVSNLSDLFGYKFVPSRPDNSTFVGTLLIQILNYNNEGDYMSRDFELNRLAFLVQHLQSLKTQDNKLFKYYVAELKKQDRYDSYWGLRFELSMASSFLDKHVNFIKQESPDFIVNNSIGIECSSIRIRKQSDKTNFDYKISALVRKKSLANYHNNSTALFIDFTNMIFNLMKKGVKIDTEEIRTYTKNSLIPYKFGSLLLFALVHTKDSLEQNYIRIDNGNINSLLKDFLDFHYPLGHHYVDGYGTSIES
jgi:hypothetical protein